MQSQNQFPIIGRVAMESNCIKREPGFDHDKSKEK